MMASLLVITGPPGAGKSTVARFVAGSFERNVLVEGDAFFAFLARDAIPPWLPEANLQNEVVVKAAASATGRCRGTYDGVRRSHWPVVPPCVRGSDRSRLPPLRRAAAKCRDVRGAGRDATGAWLHR